MNEISVSASEVLNFAMKNDMVNIELVQRQMNMQKREEIILKHPFKIWRGNDGRWRTYVYDDTRKGCRRPIAKKSRDDLEDVIVAEYYKTSAEAVTIKALYAGWIEDALSMQDIEKNTADRYQNDYDRFIRGSEFENCDIRYITSNEVIRFLKKATIPVPGQERITRKAFSNLKTVVAGIFSYAKSERELECISISYTLKDLRISDKHFKPRVVKDQEQVFSEEEALLLANHILNHYESTRDLGILLALLTGLRVGELVTLKQSDIQGTMLYVNRTEVKYKGDDGKTVYDVREFPKTENSASGIHLTDSAMNVIKMIKKLNMQNGVQSDYLFWEEEYGRLKTYFFDRKIRKMCKSLEMPTRSMHKLRKTYASYLLENGVGEKIAQAQLRHKDAATTHKYYEFSMRSKEKRQEILNEADLLKKCNHF